MQALVGLGGNLGNVRATLERAIALMHGRSGFVHACSSWYESAPLVAEGLRASEVPRYLNGVVALSTELSPSSLLADLLAIERILGRDRSAESSRWLPRLVDLDLLAMGDLVCSAREVTLPHPELHRRDFVLLPLDEVSPGWVHPISKLTAAQMLRALSAVNAPCYVARKLSAATACFSFATARCE